MDGETFDDLVKRLTAARLTRFHMLDGCASGRSALESPQPLHRGVDV